MNHDPDTLDSEYEIVKIGPFSTVSRARTSPEEEWVALKIAPVRRKFSKEPHDIVKELRILLSVYHVNIIEILSYETDARTHTFMFWMPYVPHSLSDLLTSPSFSPRPFLAQSDAQHREFETRFDVVAKSIAYQIISALAYLHAIGIAHRDIKPNNVLLTDDACVKLIDFGISWTTLPADPDHEDLWPENSEKMYFEVATGPYRAPELLFGPRSYDAFATDLWSLGCTLAEFYTPLRLCSDDEDENDTSKEREILPFVVPNDTTDPDLRWFRDTLFNAERGEIGLAWSIFKVLGTPTEDNWPRFKDLPDASCVTFTVVPPVDLVSRLPHLPSGTASVPPPLNLIRRLLVYPPSDRLAAADALQHSWFVADPPLLKPTVLSDKSTNPATLLWHGESLGFYFHELLS